MSIENIGSNESGDGQVIEKPTDENLVAALTLKLVEYRKRLEGQHHISDAYKYKVLESVLYNGRVDVAELARQITREGGNLNEDELNGAFAVIRNYVENDGVGNFDGTGLERMERSLPPEVSRKLSANSIDIYVTKQIPIKVKRTSGPIELGWTIEGCIPNNGEIVNVYVRKGDESKKVSLDELIEWNS